MKKNLFLLTLVFCIGCFMTSCEQEQVVENKAVENVKSSEIETVSNDISFIEDINAEHALITALKKTINKEDNKHLSNLNWELSKLVTYANSDKPVIYVPFEDNVSKLLMAVYNSDSNEFETLIMEVEASDQMSEDQENYPNDDLYFSGKLTISAPTGEALIINTLERGVVVHKEKTDYFDYKAPWGSEAWRDCLVDCYWDNLQELPGVVAIICGGSCVTCIGIPNPASCFACAFCVAVHYGVCMNQCTS